MKDHKADLFSQASLFIFTKRVNNSVHNCIYNMYMSLVFNCNIVAFLSLLGGYRDTSSSTCSH